MIELLAVLAVCTAPQLHGTLELQGATGSLRGGALVHNRGGPCAFGATGATIERPGAGTDVSWRPRASVAVRRGSTVWIPIVWRNWCGAPPTRLTLRLRGGGVLTFPASGAPRCDAPGRPSVVEVGRVSRR